MSVIISHLRLECVERNWGVTSYGHESLRRMILLNGVDQHRPFWLEMFGGDMRGHRLSNSICLLDNVICDMFLSRETGTAETFLDVLTTNTSIYSG